ncbi:MAG: hypothetical protein KIS87_08865 [Phycisphaeraceae bacterium]|nr:hypothetical protein [Phycisphaeraceae bacterium]
MALMLGPRDLQEAVEIADVVLDPHRKVRRSNWREYVGRWYGEDDGKRRVLNLLAYSVGVLLPFLAPDKSIYRVEPKLVRLRPEAELLSDLMGELAREIRLHEEERSAILDAILGPFGVMKWGLRAGADVVKVGGRFVSRGQLYGRYVDFDDWVCDPTARNEHELLWEGHSYRVARATLLDLGLFDSAAIERLPAMAAAHAGREDAVADFSSSGRAVDRYGPVDMVELLDVAVYDDDGQVYVCTMPRDAGYVTDYLHAEVWDGPSDLGPYSRIGLRPVNGNLLPAPMVTLWRDLAEGLNAVAGKIMENTVESKTILAYSRGAEDDVMAIMDAPNRGAVAVDDASQVRDVDIGGVHQDAAPFMRDGMGWFNILSGNIQMLAGTSADLASKTAREFEGLMSNQGLQVNDLSERCDTFRVRNAGHMLWELTTDPLIRRPGIMRIPGGHALQVEYSADAREGDYWQFLARVFRVRPQNLDPGVRSRRLIEAVSLIPQLVQIHATTGGAVPFQTFLRMFAREWDMPELAEINFDPMAQMLLESVYGSIPPVQGSPAGPVPGMNPQAYRGARPVSSPGAMPRAPEGGYQTNGIGAAQSAYAGASGADRL